MIRATFSGFSTALSALQANQKRLDITGQNLSNMNTIGYSRQQLETSSLNYTSPMSHYMNGSEISVGYGVSMDRVSQIRDPFLDAQYRSQMDKAGYSNAMQESLDSLSKILDESSISGIRQAFDDIKSTLTNMQKDASAVNDPVYESELRSRMQALTNLLNDASKQIDSAKKDELLKLDGTGASEQGAVQNVNDLLRQIGDLNNSIKKNQILGQPSLELLDERNVLLDQLSSYLPIEVSYFKDSAHTGTYTVTNPDGTTSTRDKMYDYDATGKVIGKKSWPDDMRIDLVYKDAAGVSKKITLVNGTEGGPGKNYGNLESSTTGNDPATFKLIVNGAKAGEQITASANDSQFANGSIQSSLDMLGKTGSMTPASNDVRGYQYYRDKLDNIASTFADVMNGLNGAAGDLFESKDGGPINASNIGISMGWQNGTTHISTAGDNATDTVLAMLESMSKSHAALGNKSFADFMNNVSTVLANDSSSNKNVLKNDVTILNSIQNSRDSVSGVSLDEEAANMMTYVSAYNAASRLMTALDEVLNTLINSTGLVGR